MSGDGMLQADSYYRKGRGEGKAGNRITSSNRSQPETVPEIQIEGTGRRDDFDSVSSATSVEETAAHSAIDHLVSVYVEVIVSVPDAQHYYEQEK